MEIPVKEPKKSRKLPELSGIGPKSCQAPGEGMETAGGKGYVLRRDDVKKQVVLGCTGLEFGGS